jgi:hypothetical protein
MTCGPYRQRRFKPAARLRQATAADVAAGARTSPSTHFGYEARRSRVSGPRAATSLAIAMVIAAPALIKLGVPDYAAHMFIFSYAVL